MDCIHLKHLLVFAYLIFNAPSFIIHYYILYMSTGYCTAVYTHIQHENKSMKLKTILLEKIVYRRVTDIYHRVHK